MKTLKELNKNLYNGPNASKNYDKMVNIISTLRYIDAFSLTKDEVFNYIDTKNIEIPDRWFINKEDKKIFCSGKKILGFIRDAFSHNNINELYKISKDGNFILIDMKRTKPKPLLLKIPKEDIEILVKYTNFSSNTYPTTGIEIDNFKEINPKDPSSFFDRFTFVRFFIVKKYKMEQLCILE
ncbi:MAG: hypothetical protein HUJ68_10810 [Clostridia bacterium]|nr:hypothetical protein [Clostridia bacterium]